MSSSDVPRISAARIPAFFAPFNATVATGTPLGICRILKILSHPSIVFEVSQLKNFALPKDNINGPTPELEGSIEASTKENVIRLKRRKQQLEHEKEHEINEVVVNEIDDELEQINAEFRRILSSIGQIRREGGTSSKDRKSVSNAIRRGIYRQVQTRCPACRKYFESRINLGFQCMFFPARGEVWKVRFSKKSSMLQKM